MISDTPPRNLRRLVARLRRKGYRARVVYMQSLSENEQVWVSKWVAGWRPGS